MFGSVRRFPIPRGTTALMGILVLVLMWQVALPMGGLLVTSLKTVRPVDPGFLAEPLTLANFQTILANGGLLRVTVTTLIFAVSSSLLALVFGTYLAWVTTRTDLRLTWMLGSLVLLQLAVPDFMFATSWTFLFGPEIGYFNYLWRLLSGSTDPLISIYSIRGMIIVEAFLLMPLVYLFAVPALSALDGTLEDAASMSGASRFRASIDIALPLIAPALLAIFVITVMRAWEAFDVPWVLGLRNGDMTYATRLYWDTITPPSNTGIISAYAVPMVIFASLLVWIYQRFTAQSRRFAVMAGKPAAPRLVRPNGLARFAIAGTAISLVVIGVVLPMAMIVWLSLNPFYRQPSLAAIGNVNYESFARVFQAGGFTQAVMSSLIVGCSTAVLLIVTSVLICWVSRRRPTWLSRVASLLSFAPVALPNIIIGLSFLWLYRGLGLPIHGTYVIVVLAYFTLFLAIATRNIGARFLQVGQELYDASAISGASDFRTLREIVAPMLSPAIAATALYIIIWSFKELPAALLLSSTGTRTVPVLMFDLSRSGSMSQVAAIAVTSIFMLSFLILGFQIIARKAGIRGF